MRGFMRSLLVGAPARKKKHVVVLRLYDRQYIACRTPRWSMGRIYHGTR
jgi:hypothetical protein